MKKKSISLLLTLALIISLFVGVTVPASASTTYWTDTGIVGNGFNGGDGKQDNPFQIATAAQLAYLAQTVNNGTTDYSGKYFILTADINLSGHNWKPIGGMWSANSGTPASTAKYFAGVFNGYDTIANTQRYITGLKVEEPYSGIGLFGYVNGGILGNLDVTGTVEATGSKAAIGGIVGYTNGSLVNCASHVAVTAPTGSANVGGLAGIVENTVTADLVSANTVIVRGCSSSANVTGDGTRTGGLIGGAYAYQTGAVLVDRCSVTGGTVSTTNGAYKTFIGGLIGYCEASVSNCLVGTNVTVHVEGDDGHRMGGIAGVLSSWGTAAGRMADCVFLGKLDNPSATPAYDGALSVAESGTTTVNCFYYTNNSTSTSRYNATQSTNGATNVYGLNASQMLDNSLVSSSSYISDFLTATGIPSWKTAFNGAWNYSSPHNSNVLPSLLAITDGKTCGDLNSFGRGTSYTGNDSAYPSTAVYYDGTAASAGSGTDSSPYNTFSTAVSAAGTNGTIVIKSEISLSDFSAQLTNLSGKTIGRSYTYTGPMLSVTTGNLTISNVTFDGNENAIGNQTMLYINGGNVTLDSGATLQNNSTISRDSAVRVDSGSLTVNSGASITGNKSALGGVIYIEHNATFTYAGSGIAAGQMVYLANSPGTSDAYVTLSATPSVILTIRMANPGDSIKAVGGDGTYTVTSATTPMISAPGYLVLLGTNQITLSEIYLNTGAGTNGTGTSASPFNSLTTAVSNAASTGAPIHVVNGISISSSTTISDDVSFIGPSGSTMFTVASGGTLTLSGNVKLTGCGTAVSVSSGGTFAMSNGSIIGNTTSGNGGGVYVNGGTFTMTGGTITGNSATNGGAVYIGSGTFTMNGGTISGNTATLGAGVYVTAGSTFSLGCSGIASSDVIYLSNSNGNSDAYITLTVSLTNKISIQCANPNPGSSGTRIVFGSTSTIISSDTLSNISCPGYSLSRKTNATPKYIYISGIAS